MGLSTDLSAAARGQQILPNLTIASVSAEPSHARAKLRVSKDTWLI